MSPQLNTITLPADLRTITGRLFYQRKPISQLIREGAGKNFTKKERR